MKMNFYGRELPVFRANLHTHSTVSDGQYSPQEVIDIYAKAGYDVLAFSDHRKMNPVSSYDPKGMTLISGVEMHPMGPRGIIWHLLCLNVPEDFPAQKYTANPDTTGQDVIDAVHAAGGIVFCAHPFWCGFTSAEIMNNLSGLAGIEVFNSSCVGIGKAYNDQCWDELITAGLVKGAIAVDDVHNSSHLFGGWTMIAAPDKSVGSIMNALNTGSFYATQGPEIYRLEFKNRTFEADFSEVEEAILMSESCRGYRIVTPNFPEHGDRHTAVTAKIELPQSFRGTLRLRIRDSLHRYAWSAPISVL